MKLVWLALLVAYCGFIFYLSHQSVLPTPMLFTHQDKLFHAVAYAVLGFFAIGYFSGALDGSWQAFIVAMMFSALYGASDEWHQSFVDGRVADVFDWLADCVGAVIGISVMSYFKAIRT